MEESFNLGSMVVDDKSLDVAVVDDASERILKPVVLLAMLGEKMDGPHEAPGVKTEATLGIGDAMIGSVIRLPFQEDVDLRDVRRGEIILFTAVLFSFGAEGFILILCVGLTQN